MPGIGAVGKVAKVAGKVGKAADKLDDLQTVYRVYGGEANAVGRYWTPVNPNSVDNYRKAAGLPPSNSGRFVIEGSVSMKNVNVTPGGAAAIGKNTGGITEYFISDPSKVKINRVSGVNPTF